MSEPLALHLALTLGEPAGIGPDLTIQLWRRRVELRLPAFYLIADPEFIRQRARVLGVDVTLSAVTPAQAAKTFARALPIVALDAPLPHHPAR
jgi:4-hydroxythreonine-4-phosphate dehydrogenase